MRVLTIIGLLISTVALVISAWTFVTVNNDARFDVAAERALAKREKQLISKLWPSLQKVYSELGGSHAPKEEPKTIEELFGPLFTLMEPIGGK